MRSPTSTPPASSSWFQPSPNSRRSMWVLALNETRSLPQGSWRDHPARRRARPRGSGRARRGYQLSRGGCLCRPKPSALEGHLRELSDVEEVARAQVVVALVDAGVDAAHVDGDLHGRAGDVVVELQSGLPSLEVDSHLGKGHVPHAEVDTCVGVVDGVDGVLAGSTECLSWCWARISCGSDNRKRR